MARRPSRSSSRCVACVYRRAGDAWLCPVCGHSLHLSQGSQTFDRYWQMFAPADAPVFTPEYRFAAQWLGRKWAFDVCFLERRLAVEIDGGRWAMGGGRHMEATDYLKRAAAAQAGYTLIAFSTEMLNAAPLNCIQVALDCAGYDGARLVGDAPADALQWPLTKKRRASKTKPLY